MDFTKTDRTAPPGFFATEAAGLRWLAAAESARVVDVLEVGDQHIRLARLTPGPATAPDAEAFGQALARTHGAGADGWGAPPPGAGAQGFIGPLRQANQPEATWGEFYARHRVRPFADRAYAEGSIDADGHRLLAVLCDRLEVGDFDDEAVPARIHGDLWSGNVISTPGGWTLIDPAAHGGHPLTDLAMLALFGNPHLERTFSAYAETAALQTGWRDLLALHQVHPLLVHAVLFGSSYGRSAIRAARSYVSTQSP